MSTLKENIDTYNAAKQERLPAEILDTMARCTEDLKLEGIEKRALRTGDRMPDFELPNQHGEMKRLSDYLSIAPLVLNLSIIGSVLFIAPTMPTPVVGLALGVLIGGILQLALQLPILIRKGFRFWQTAKLSYYYC